MSLDPAGPAPETPDTPTIPPADTPADVDWRKRYEDLQPEYTRTTQELAQARKLIDGQDPDALKSVLEKYGYTLDEDEPDEPDTPDNPLLSDVQELKQWRQQQDDQQQQQVTQSQWAGWTEYVKTKAQENGVELSDWEIKALQLDSAGQKGLPVEPEKAEQVLKTYLTQREQWLEQQTTARKRPRVPHVPAGGGPAGGGKDPADMTSQEIERHMLDRWRAETA